MDREQEEMQFLGLYGMYKESIKIIFTWRKIFSKITLALILPLTFIFLAHIEVSRILLYKIWHDEDQEFTAADQGSRQLHHLSDVVKSDWVLYWVLKAAYFTFLLVFSLLSTAAVVYTIASIYTGRDVTFKKVMTTVVPKVWKRLMVTFVCTFFGLFIYNILAFLIAEFYFSLIKGAVLEVISVYVLFLAYLVGFAYVTVIWQLASVVTVLESSYGVRAMLKSKDLIKGNRRVAIIVFFKLIFSFYFLQFSFRWFVVYGYSKAPMRRVGLGILCFLLLFKLFLFGLVIQTVLYLVCKSYHHENIDKSNLSNHLEAYLGDYEPLSGKDVQLEQYDI